MSDDRCKISEAPEFITIKEIICLRFGFEKDNDRSSLRVLISNTFNHLFIEIVVLAFCKLNYSVTFWID